jgi:hypothetical protein
MNKKTRLIVAQRKKNKLLNSSQGYIKYIDYLHILVEICEKKRESLKKLGRGLFNL